VRPRIDNQSRSSPSAATIAHGDNGADRIDASLFGRIEE
jgi:hypothetical protein